ncbi:hypothetical protein BDA99DRAFT_523962 [Phascolomyces articulosus]|uniref:Uncharacterized protein n=1 Tax=Phascolomyces articulosus TaxID=60185 RepID=A0AAD5K0N7_9FUNG|nr:hypothetical protein BDA99DRAFT_523962 [Phascolomyces articulosus]
MNYLKMTEISLSISCKIFSFSFFSSFSFFFFPIYLAHQKKKRVGAPLPEYDSPFIYKYNYSIYFLFYCYNMQCFFFGYCIFPYYICISFTHTIHPHTSIIE